jgi:exopolyphosphatase/guanosine-5'-triphosphate,3'-diphosphate pyrophosphatase
MGSVRLLEELRPRDPPGEEALRRCRQWVRDFLNQQVAAELAAALGQCQEQPRLVGTGGTATILARMEAKMADFDRERIEATVVGLEGLRSLVERLWGMLLVERRQMVGLPANRADVILTGGAIYEGIMERFGFAQLQVSTRGLRYWALSQAAGQ